MEDVVEIDPQFGEIAISFGSYKDCYNTRLFQRVFTTLFSFCLFEITNVDI
jgi:hypothetical protein